MKIIAALALEPGQPLSIEEVELNDQLGPHEVLVKNVASGICHSDMSMRDLPHGYPFLPKPAILGHEGAGVVQKVGSEVTALEPGDHVVMSYHFDGTCPNCQKKLHPYCDSFLESNIMGFRLNGSRSVTSEKYDSISASYHQQSSFATWSVATDNNAVKVPKHLPLEALGPLGCGFLTGAGIVLHRLKPTPGSSFAVFGVGPVGFAAMYMARKAGCSTIIAVDLHESRLALAKQFGATHTINAGEVSDSVKAIQEISPGGVDYVVEAVGSIHVMNQVVPALATRGHGVISGVVLDPEANLVFPPAPFQWGKQLSGITMGDADMPGTLQTLVDAIEVGDFPIEKLITYYDFADINQAIADSEKGVTIKPVVKFPA